MSIQEELAEELRDAMRAKDARRRDVIRQIQTEVSVARSTAGFSGNVDDDLYRDVIASYTKRMRKSIDEYRGLGERGQAMADKLSYEVEYLSRWLPATLGEDETRAMVREAIAELGVDGDEKATGRVIGRLMKSHRDELDGTLVARIVREELASG
jgi:uncharacterized protein YqeY